MLFTAVVQNDTIKLPIHVPDGTTVEITVAHDPAQAEQQPWMELVGCLACEAEELRRIDRMVKDEFHLSHGTRVPIASPDTPPVPVGADNALHRLAERPVDDVVTDATLRHDAHLE